MKPSLRRCLAATSVLVLAVSACTTGNGSDGAAPGPRTANTRPVSDSLGRLIAASTDRGPSHASNVEVLVTLPGRSRPEALYRWAAAHGLRVDWRSGEAFAMVSGAAAAMSGGFGVAVHDFRSRSGTEFYATRTDATVPSALRGAITRVGRMLSYPPDQITAAGLGGIRTDVPDGGLTAKQLLQVYGATGLAQQGFTGKGKTIVFFEIDGFKQSDLDAFTKDGGLSSLTPTVDSVQPGEPGGETPMDLEVAHAIAPDAKLVVYDARFTNVTTIAQVGAAIARQYQEVDKKYPGAIWSISLGLRCEDSYTLADLQPGQDALEQALAHGTTAFVSSGDAGSLECKGRRGDFGDNPDQDDVGLNALAGPPGITVVGGTALSTDSNGNWIAEQAWTETATQQGTSGGPSNRFTRPSWQQASGIAALPNNTFRMTPDISADADPATGARIIIDGEPAQGGGTSQAAPIWAALTVLMNEYLVKNGGKPAGDLNPLLYKAAASTPSAFHDVTLGGNSVDSASAGFDYATGLGSPDVAELAPALLAAQKGA